MKPVFVPVAMDCHDHTALAGCSRCGNVLEIHQPDENLPKRLLGTCDRCKAWFLIDLDEAILVLLPDELDA